MAAERERDLGKLWAAALPTPPPTAALLQEVAMVRLYRSITSPLSLLAAGSAVLFRSSGIAAMSTSKPAYKGALVFLHGLGDTPAGWSSLEKALPSIKPKLGGIKYCFPAAPIIPITINGGMQMPGWFGKIGSMRYDIDQIA